MTVCALIWRGTTAAARDVSVEERKEIEKKYGFSPFF
jgi:hypothetical protein